MLLIVEVYLHIDALLLCAVFQCPFANDTIVNVYLLLCQGVVKVFQLEDFIQLTCFDIF